MAAFFKRNKVVYPLSVLVLAFVLVFSAFSSEVQAASNFKDVSENYWAYPAIKELTDEQIILGYTDGTFKPHAAVTRAQSAMFIVRALDIPTTEYANPGFSDVSTKTSGYAEIAALVDMGVLSKAKKFNPSEPATRGQMAKMLALAFELKGTSNKTNNFKDVSVNNSFYPFINALVANGVTEGTAIDRFGTYDNVTRVQMAVFIKKILDLNEAPPANGLPAVPTVPAANEKIMDEIVVLINKERAKVGAPALKVHEGVEDIALIKSKDMVDNNYFAHESPTLGLYSDLLKKAGISYRAAGENLVAGYTTAESAVNAWMNSPGHKENLLNPVYTHTGVGTYTGGAYRMYHTQIFITQ